MAGVNTPSVVTNITQTEFFLAADTTQEQGVVAKNVFRNLPISKGKGQQGALNKFGKWNAYEFTPGTEINQEQQFAITRVNLVPKHIAVHTVIEDFADWIASESLDHFGGILVGDAVNRFIDIDLLSTLDAIPVSIGAGGTPRIGHIFDAVSYIDGNQNEPVEGEKVALIHPYHHRVLAEDLAGLDATSRGLYATTANRTQPGDGALRDQILSRYVIKELAEVTVIRAGNLPIPGGVGKGGVIVKNKTMVYGQWAAFKMETQRSALLQGDHLVGVARYGRVQHLTYGGVELNWAATTAVS